MSLIVELNVRLFMETSLDGLVHGFTSKISVHRINDISDNIENQNEMYIGCSKLFSKISR